MGSSHVIYLRAVQFNTRQSSTLQGGILLTLHFVGYRKYTLGIVTALRWI